MKSKLLIMLLSLFCLSTMADEPKTHLLIWAKDKSMAIYPLADKPKMTFTETSLVITYKGAEAVYPLDDMARFTYEDETTIGLLGCDTALLKKLEATEETISSLYSDVAVQFTESFSTLQDRIGDLKRGVIEDLTTGKLDKIARLTEVNTISSEIEQLLTDAAAAQTAFEEEQAELQKKAANQAAFEALTAKVDTLQQSLNNADANIVDLELENYSEFVLRISNIQSMIDVLRTELRKLYEAIELNADSELDQNRVKAIEDAIKQLLEDALKEATVIKGVTDYQTEESPFKFDGTVLFFPALKANSTVSIYTLNGTLVFSKTVQTAGEYSFPLSSLDAGIYMVTVNGLNSKILKR